MKQNDHINLKPKPLHYTTLSTPDINMTDDVLQKQVGTNKEFVFNNRLHSNETLN